ncbi:MAG: peptidylprolyl isomerase [Verrucomicrobia bacterium]|nr:peptidylprolyl isomerase [Verrucomicrobiota bacterium]
MRISPLISLAGAAAFFATTAAADLANGIKAIVGDAVITYQQVEANASRAVELLRRQYATRPDLYQKKLTETLNDALEDLVQRQLILHEFKASGFSLPESVTEEGVQERIRGRFGDRATLTKTLQAEHLTFEMFRQQIKDQIIIDAMRGKYVSSGIIISPRKIETYYGAHQDEFKQEDQVKLRMIVLDSAAAPAPEARKKLADEILGKITDGASFSEMAAIYSTGSQRNQGGDWGWVQRSVLRQELAETAFTLKAGQRSGVIETPDSCYLMLVEETRASHVKPIGDVRDEIEKTIQAQERTKTQKEWIDRLKKKTFVRYF